LSETTVRSRWVRANGVRTRYVEAGGDGTPIVALHGGGHGSSGMSGMGLLMRELAADYTIYAPDSVGGYGETDVAAPTPLGLLNRVDQMRDFVDTLCLDKFVVMGNSQGAWAAAQYAALYPNRVSKIILVSSLTIAQAMGLDQKPTQAMKWLMEYDGSREAMRRLLEGLIVDKSRVTDELIDRRQASATRPGAMEAMDRFLKATAGLRKDPVLSQQLDMRKSLPALTKAIPTIFIWGEDDPFALAETGRALEPLIPDVKFHWVAKAGHQVQTDQPRICADIIRAFVGK
jgi:pimeloyl-ACP methyl ester carboxylesterase